MGAGGGGLATIVGFVGFFVILFYVATIPLILIFSHIHLQLLQFFANVAYVYSTSHC